MPELKLADPERYVKAMAEPSALALKLQKIIKEERNIEVVPKINRTYAGYWQRREGVWSWFMFTREGRVVGSQWPATKVAAAEHREYSVQMPGGDIHVTPE